MERTEINGLKVIHEFKMYHYRWECDGYGWVTEDGQIWQTSHSTNPRNCNPFEASHSEMLDKISELNDAISGMVKALSLADQKTN